MRRYIKGDSPSGNQHGQVRRLWRISSSLAVTVPYRVVRELGLEAGHLVLVKFSRLDVRPAPPDLAKGLQRELLGQLAPALGWLAQFDGPAGHLPTP